MADWTIYYNPKCGTCRKTLEILEKKKIKPRIVEYLKTPPTPKEIEAILKKLNLEPAEMVRKKEEIYSELKLDSGKHSRAEWLAIIAANPILIERPIVVRDDKAVIARPPEEVENLF